MPWVGRGSGANNAWHSSTKKHSLDSAVVNRNCHIPDDQLESTCTPVTFVPRVQAVAHEQKNVPLRKGIRDSARVPFCQEGGGCLGIQLVVPIGATGRVLNGTEYLGCKVG